MTNKSIISAVLFLVLAACNTLSKSPTSSLRLPSNENSLVQAADLKRVGPLGVLEELRSHCCNGVMIQKSDVSFWGEAEIAQLTNYIDDPTPVSPVYRPTSGVRCQGERFTSTLGHEARHLIAAIRSKTYPMSQCSTYDLRLD